MWFYFVLVTDGSFLSGKNTYAQTLIFFFILRLLEQAYMILFCEELYMEACCSLGTQQKWRKTGLFLKQISAVPVLIISASCWIQSDTTDSDRIF